MTFIRWFNDSILMQFLFTPLRFLRFWKTAQRARFCEQCLIFSYDVHWCKNDMRTIDGIKYDRLFKCDYCFYQIEHE